MNSYIKNQKIEKKDLVGRVYKVNKGKHIVDFIDSPFSKIIPTECHINNIKSIASNKLNTDKNTPIADGIGIELRTWKKLINREYIKSLTYKRINEFCLIPIDKARESIQFIDEIEFPNLPLNFDSKEGVRLDVGVFNEGRMRDRIIEYNNKDKEVLSKMLSCGKKLIGNNFNAKIGVDKRNETYCIYFPPIFAKRYTKLGLTKRNKNESVPRIPKYVFNNEEYQKIWWQGNMSEEASIYPLISKKDSNIYLIPRIQLNRVKSIGFLPYSFEKENTYYQRDISSTHLEFLKNNPMKLMVDEAEILKTFGINIRPYFSKIYVNKGGKSTATYTILLYKVNDTENYLNHIGFELNRHKRQMELLLNNRGKRTKDEIRDTLIKFYKLTPDYLRGIKKIAENKWLTEEDKQELLNEHDKTTGNSICRPC